MPSDVEAQAAMELDGQLWGGRPITVCEAIPPSTSYLQNVPVTATVSGVNGAGTGNFQFIVDGTSYGVPMALSGGAAGLTLNGGGSLPAGTHMAGVTYAGAQAIPTCHSSIPRIRFRFL
jgi:Bacterial Ig-like domain (group 3)